MLDLVKQNEFGRRAEHRTEVFLLDHFWVMKLAVGLDGAVFLVQSSTRTVDSLNQQIRSCRFAVVKSLSCQEGAEVEIAKLLVERSDRQPQNSFFVSIHILDSFGVASDYFFSAEDVQSCFKRKSNQTGQEVFVFSVTEGKNFSQFRKKPRDRVQMILKALSGPDLERSQAFLKLVLEHHVSGSVQPPMVQVSENQWQMRHDQTLFEFERDENDIIHGSKSDLSGQRPLTPFLPAGSFEDFVFDPFNEEWIPRSH